MCCHVSRETGLDVSVLLVWTCSVQRGAEGWHCFLRACMHCGPALVSDDMLYVEAAARHCLHLGNHSITEVSARRRELFPSSRTFMRETSQSV